MTEGPKLIKGRYLHSCGKAKDKDGNVIVIAAGGDEEYSVEMLNTSLMDEWTEGNFFDFENVFRNLPSKCPFFNKGPTLPYNIGRASMVQSKENTVVLVGGTVGHDTLNTILELDINDFEWKEITLPIETLRQDHLAFAATEDQLKLFCGKFEK